MRPYTLYREMGLRQGYMDDGEDFAGVHRGFRNSCRLNIRTRICPDFASESALDVGQTDDSGLLSAGGRAGPWVGLCRKLV